MPALCVGAAAELRRVWPWITSVTSTMWESCDAPVLLDRELDGCVGAVIEEALEPAELALARTRGPAPAPRSSCP